MTTLRPKWPKMAQMPDLNLNDLILSFWRDEEMWCLQRMFYFMNLQRPVFLLKSFQSRPRLDRIETSYLREPEVWLDLDQTWPLNRRLPNLSFIPSLDENHEKQELLIERAQGQYLIDNDGEHYLDLINNVAHGKFSSGFWVKFGWMVQVIWSVSRLRSRANLFAFSLWVAANISTLLWN